MVAENVSAVKKKCTRYQWANAPGLIDENIAPPKNALSWFISRSYADPDGCITDSDSDNSPLHNNNDNLPPDNDNDNPPPDNKNNNPPLDNDNPNNENTDNDDPDSNNPESTNSDYIPVIAGPSNIHYSTYRTRSKLKKNSTARGKNSNTVSLIITMRN